MTPQLVAYVRSWARRDTAARLAAALHAARLAQADAVLDRAFGPHPK